MFAAATRAWYFPRCVRSPTPDASPIAQTPSPARRRSSTVTPRRVISTPSCSSPMSATLGCRPVATRRRSASSTSPPSSDTRIPLPPCSTRRDAVATSTRMPSCSNRSASRAPASASSAREQVLVVLDERHLGADPPEELRELDADRSSAEHDEARRDLARPDRLAIRPVLDVLDAVERRQGRPRSGRDDELVVLELSLADGDDSGPRDARVPAHELRTLILDPPGVPRVVTPVGDLVAPPPARARRRSPR